MHKFQRILLLFLAMYVIATALGFATYLLINPTAMWISVFTIMPIVAALLIRLYLIQIRCSPGRSLREVLLVVAIWIVFSFLLDAVTYIVIIPTATHMPRNWSFFADQSPWIWLSYAVLLCSGFAANWLHTRRAKTIM
jgi:hypothetical protein